MRRRSTSSDTSLMARNPPYQQETPSSRSVGADSSGTRGSEPRDGPGVIRIVGPGVAPAGARGGTATVTGISFSITATR
jgi:hypothetical protein